MGGRPLAVARATPLELDGAGAVLHESDEPLGSAVVLPGGSNANHRLGGTPARPDLHYTRELLLARRLSVLELWWRSEEAPDDPEAWLLAQARAAVAAAPDPLRVAVARSWGSRALAKLVLVGEAPDVLVWIAPLARHPEVADALARRADRSFVAVGTADELVGLDDLPPAVTLATVEGGDHALQVGSAPSSARALAEVLDSLDGFLRDALR